MKVIAQRSFLHVTKDSEGEIERTRLHPKGYFKGKNKDHTGEYDLPNKDAKKYVKAGYVVEAKKSAA